MLRLVRDCPQDHLAYSFKVRLACRIRDSDYVTREDRNRIAGTGHGGTCIRGPERD